jgi:hypothetical protein
MTLVKIKRIAYALICLASLAVSVGAGWRPAK